MAGDILAEVPKRPTPVRANFWALKPPAEELSSSGDAAVPRVASARHVRKIVVADLRGGPRANRRGCEIPEASRPPAGPQGVRPAPAFIMTQQVVFLGFSRLAEALSMIRRSERAQGLRLLAGVRFFLSVAVSKSSPGANRLPSRERRRRPRVGAFIVSPLDRRAPPGLRTRLSLRGRDDDRPGREKDHTRQYRRSASHDRPACRLVRGLCGVRATEGSPSGAWSRGGLPFAAALRMIIRFLRACRKGFTKAFESHVRRVPARRVRCRRSIGRLTGRRGHLKEDSSIRRTCRGLLP